MAKPKKHLVARAFDGSVIGHLLSAYPALPERSPRGKKSAADVLRRTVASGVEGGMTARVFGSLGRFLLACRMRVYGVFFLSLGCYAALTWLLTSLIRQTAEPLSDLFWALGVAVVSLPLLFSGKTFSGELCSTALGTFLENALGVRRETMETDEVRGRSHVALLLGLLFGGLSYFVPLPYLLLAFAAFVWLLRVFIQPEFGVPLLFFAMPLVPTLALVIAVCVLCVSFALKLIRGNRTFRPEVLDAAVLVFGFCILFGGIGSVSSASLQPALVYICFLGAFFLVVFSMTTEAWIGRCIGAALTGGFVVSLIGILEAVTGRISSVPAWLDQTVFGSVAGRAVSTLENPNMLGEYLVLLLPLALSAVLYAGSARKRFFSVAVFAAMVACLGLSFSRGAWAAAAAALVLYLLLDRRAIWPILLIGAALALLLIWVLPSDFYLRLTTLSDSSVVYRVHIWEGTLLLLRDFVWSGIGVGYPAWQTIYPTYALEAIETAPHAHSLPLVLLVEVGAFGLVLFAVVILLFCLSQNRFRRESRRFTSESDDPLGAGIRSTRAAAAALRAGVFGSLVFGLVDHAWYNYRVYLLFWLVLGLASAAARVGCAAIERRKNAAGAAENGACQASLDLTAGAGKDVGK